MAGVKDKNCELVAKRWALALMELAQEDENISKEDILELAKNIEIIDILAVPQKENANVQIQKTEKY